jgi:DNA polymerase IV
MIAATMPLPETAPAWRRIIHIDMDAFYASVEQRDNPSLRGKPVAVGSDRARGVVMAASYEARRFGVRSAMASITAQRKCPELLFVRPRFDIYSAVSQQIRAIFARYTQLIQPLSLDEAYLDVTATVVSEGRAAAAIAADIKAAIRAETGLTASAGVSYNKFLAKLASDHRKPDGLFVISPKTGVAFVAELSVEKFHGVGPVTAARMKTLGINTGADLRRQSRAFLAEHFGKAGDFYYAIARAEDDRPVNPDREAKSLGAERTFEHDLRLWEEVEPALYPLCHKVWAAYEQEGRLARTVTVKIKYADFQRATRSRSAAAGINSLEVLKCISLELLAAEFPPRVPVRLLGVTLSNFEPELPAQLSLTFSPPVR